MRPEPTPRPNDLHGFVHFFKNRKRSNLAQARAQLNNARGIAPVTSHKIGSHWNHFITVVMKVWN
jgi:hypothetical protein